MEKKTGIIVALDNMDIETAINLAHRLKGRGVMFKANDLLDGEFGPAIITKLKVCGGVMADPKFHDIPKTVQNRVNRYSVYGPDLLTVHASGGVEMMQAAVEAAKDKVIKILAVTVLTSLDNDQCQENYGAPSKEKVKLFAEHALKAGVYGIVCSPKELEYLSQFPELAALAKVTPGIRPAGQGKKDDQKRTDTPANAQRMGATYIVIGRPITEAADPVEALKQIQAELSQV